MRWGGQVKPFFECVPSQKGLLAEPPQRHSANLAASGGVNTLPFWSAMVMRSPSMSSGPLVRAVILVGMVQVL